jgi:hypothetical protein
MSAKLSSYPDLANTLGMTKVTSCDEARAFMRGYYEYLEAHPGFDAESRSK